MEISRAEAIAGLFKKLDKNQDGKLNPDEQVSIFGTSGEKAMDIDDFSVKVLKEGYMDNEGNVSLTPENQLPGKYSPSAKDKQNLNKIFAGTEFADNINNHNQALDAIEYAKSKGVKIPQILINFDSHSDIYTGRDSYVSSRKGASIANWVNECIAKHDLTDVYWVIPENMANDEEVKAILSGEKEVKNKGSKYSKPLLQNLDKTRTANPNKSDFIQTFIVDKKDGKLFHPNLSEEEMIAMLNGEKMIDEEFYKDNSASGTWREKFARNTVYQEKMDDGRDRFAKVNIHFVTENTLPDFKDKNVMTSIDMDYFSNSGADTMTLYRDNKNEEEKNKAFSKTLDTIAKAGIKPVIHTTCLSDDDYLPHEDIEQATDFANAVITSTPQKTDNIKLYSRTHNENYDSTKPYEGI